MQWQRVETPKGSIVFAPSPPFASAEEMLSDMFSKVASFVESPDAEIDDDLLLTAAATVYLPKPIHIRLDDFDPSHVADAADAAADVSSDDVMEDYWSPMYLATVTCEGKHLVWLLKFHASYALRIIRILAGREAAKVEYLPERYVVTVGDAARALLVDDRCSKSDDECLLDSLTVSHVSGALVPYLTALSAVLCSPSSSKTVASTTSPASSSTQDYTRGSGCLLSVAKDFVEAMHEDRLVPTSPTKPSVSPSATVVRRSSAANEASGPTPFEMSVRGAGGGGSDGAVVVSSSVARYRHHLYVDTNELYESVCELGKLSILTKLQLRLPLGPVFFVKFDHSAADTYISSTSSKLAAASMMNEFAAFPIHPQESVKFAFFHQCFPELPSPVASLRHATSLQKVIEVSSTSSTTTTTSSRTQEQDRADAVSYFSVSLMHFRLYRRLISKTQDLTYFKEYHGVVAKEMKEKGVMPIGLPLLYAITAEFAQRPEVPLTPVVLEKLTWLLREDPSVDRFLIRGAATDAARFSELWVGETFIHGPKKFRTRVEMLAHAVEMHRHIPSSPSAAAADSLTPSALQRRASFGALPSPVAPSSSSGAAAATDGKENETQKKTWSACWEHFFSRLAELVSKKLASPASEEDHHNADEERAALEEVAASLTRVLALLSASSGTSSEASTESMPLAKRFETAEKAFGAVAAKQSNEIKLRFYGLFKQATVGDVNISRPWAMDVAGRAKYDAWAAWKGKTQEEAMNAYVDQWLLLSSTMNK